MTSRPRESLTLAQNYLSCDCAQLFENICKKSVKTKLSSAIGLWGNGQHKKNLASPPSPPSSPTSSPEKSPSFNLKSRFFSSYMSQKKESKGKLTSPNIHFSAVSLDILRMNKKTKQQDTSYYKLRNFVTETFPATFRFEYVGKVQCYETLSSI